MLKKRYIIVIIVVVIVGGVIVGMFWKKGSAIRAIEDRLNVELKNSVTIVSEQKTKQYGEEHVDAKLRIQDGERSKVENELNKFFSEEVSKSMGIPNFKNTCTWWDLDEKNIVSKYFKMTSGKKAKTIEIWAFIAEVDGREYLYISY